MMYFLLLFQFVAPDIGAWTQLGAYETKEQCMAVAQAVKEPTSIQYICAPSKPEGKKV